MKNLIQNIRTLSGLKRIVSKSAHTLIIIPLIIMIPSSVSADRFDPPTLSTSLQEFDSRISGNLVNVDFIIAHVLNNGRKTVREVGEITDTFEELLNNTAFFTNNTGTNNATAGSVVIPPGTSADTIIILNQNEGDSIAIER